MSLRVLLGLAPFAALACGGSSPRATTLPPPEAKSVRQIVDAVAEHDRRCALRTPPRDASRVAAELGITDCASDIDSLELRDCLGEIAREPCSEPAHVRRIPTCRLGAVCRSLEEGTL